MYLILTDCSTQLRSRSTRGSIDAFISCFRDLIDAGDTSGTWVAERAASTGVWLLLAGHRTG